jgi:hypothetical protein
MLAGPLAALRLGLLTRGHPINVAARLSSYPHCAKFSSRLFRRARPASIISSKTFCSSEIKTNMADTNGTTAASMDEVEALRKQVEDLKVIMIDLYFCLAHCVFADQFHSNNINLQHLMGES